MIALLVFIIATFEKVFGRKKLLDTKGLFGDNVIRNPARYIHYETKQIRFFFPLCKRYSGTKRFVC